MISIGGGKLSSLRSKKINNDNKSPSKKSHKGRQFFPRLLPIFHGEKVNFYSDDSIYHNAPSLSTEKPFNLAIYAETTSKLVRFYKPGQVKIYCVIHPRVMGNILVMNNPFSQNLITRGTFRQIPYPFEYTRCEFCTNSAILKSMNSELTSPQIRWII